jgi:hypothetical protein
MNDAPDKALTFIPDILAAHQAHIDAQKGTLDHAFKAGDLLNRAKETVIADNDGKRGKWEEWRGRNLRGICQTMASNYMRLAKHEPEIRKQQRVATNLAGEGKWTIRAALKLIPKTQKELDRAAKAKATRAEKKAAKEAAEATKSSTRSSITIGDLLPNTAPDELFIAVRHSWEKDDLKKLVSLITDYLNQPQPTAPVPTPNVGEIDRRI